MRIFHVLFNEHNKHDQQVLDVSWESDLLDGAISIAICYLLFSKFSSWQ